MSKPAGGTTLAATVEKRDAVQTEQTVSQAVRIEGVVRGAEGQGVADALVATIPVDARREAKLVKTDGSGRFEINGLPPSSYALTATAPGRVGAYLEPVQLTTGSVRSVELRMVGEALTLRGSVVRRNGPVVGGAIIRALRFSPFKGDLFVGTSDPSGAFALTVPSGRYTVSVEATNLGATPKAVEGSGDVAVQFELTRVFAADKPPPPEVIEWLRANALQLSTPEAGHGFDDLRALREVIGNARIVALGEATHGTREFFQLKHRIFEFLATEMGFTVFGIEASYPEALAVNDYVLHGRGDPADALSSMRFWTWDTEEVLEQIRWMRRYNEDQRHAAKLEFYGFDMQSPSGAVQQTIEYLRKVDLAFARQVAPVLAPLDNDFDVQDYAQLPKAKIVAAADGLARILKRLDDRKGAYLQRSSLTDWIVARMNTVVAAQGEEKARSQSYSVRDRSMAENIKALLDQQPPGTRMVVWAHNGHVMKSQGSDAMGEHLARMFGSNMVVFGFAFNEGSFQARQIPFERGGRVQFTVPAAPPGSLDASLATAGKLLALDLRRAPSDGIVAEWLHSLLKHRDIGAGFSDELAHRFLRDIVPSHSFDALLFVDKTSSARANPRLRNDTPFVFRTYPKAASPVNLDFEEVGPNREPTGWIVYTGAEKGSYAVAASDNKPFHGKRCASLTRDRAPWHWGYGALFQNLDATPYRGKRIRFRAAGRAQISGLGNRSELFVKAFPRDLQSPPKPLSFASTLEHPVTSGTWRIYELEALVPAEADSVQVGFMLAGNGRAWFDHSSIEILGDATAAR